MMLSVNFSLFSRLLFAPSLESGPGRVQKTLFIARARASSESSRPLHPPTIVNLHPQNSIIGHFMRRSSFNCEEEEGMTKRSKVSMRRLLSWIMFFCAVVGAFAALFFPSIQEKSSPLLFKRFFLFSQFAVESCGCSETRSNRITRYMTLKRSEKE